LTEQQSALDKLKSYEDDLDDILNMKPGNFKQNQQMVEKLERRESEPSSIHRDKEEVRKVVPALK